MIPDGFFKVWVATNEQLRAVLEVFEDAGIKWRSGTLATDLPYIEAPVGLSVGFDASRWGGRDRQLTFNDDYDDWGSRSYFDVPIYTVEDLVQEAMPASYNSVLGIMEY